MAYGTVKKTPTKARTLGAAGKGQRPAATSRVPQKVGAAAFMRKTNKAVATRAKTLLRK